MNSNVPVKVNGHCNGEAEEDKSEEHAAVNGINGCAVDDIDIDEGIEMGEEFSTTSPVGPHCSSSTGGGKRPRKLISPTPIVISKVSGAIPLPPPTTLSIGGTLKFKLNQISKVGSDVITLL